MPLLFGAAIGLLFAGLEAAARVTINPALRAATNAGEFLLAYRQAPVARFAHVALFSILAATTLFSFTRYGEIFFGVFCGIVASQFFALAILGFWTACSGKAEANAL